MGAVSERQLFGGVLEPNLPFQFQGADVVPVEQCFTHRPSGSLRIGAEHRPITSAAVRERQQGRQRGSSPPHLASGSAISASGGCVTPPVAAHFTPV